MNDAAASGRQCPRGHGAAPVVREVEIVNKKGLHARASAKFVQTPNSSTPPYQRHTAATKPSAAPRSWA